jgi:asparagine synthase (glutamine-hydrolysing)
VLPDEILYRPKHGFAVPLGRWFRGNMGTVAREVLLSERARQRGVFDPAYVERLFRRHHEGRELDFHIWTLLSFELWCRTFLDGRAGPAPRPRPAPRPVHARSGSAHLRLSGQRA